MLYDYSYTKVISPDRLSEEIRRNLNIKKGLDHVSTVGENTKIFFKDELSLDEQAALDVTVSGHIAIPLPENKVVKVQVESLPANASKTLSDGRKLYKRVHGIGANVTVGENIINFTMPHGHAKFMAIEFINTAANETVDLLVYDDAVGTYSSVPDGLLNQFGFMARVSKDYYKHYSEFDADICIGMVITIKYTALEAKELGINLIMNEVKSE